MICRPVHEKSLTFRLAPFVAPSARVTARLFQMDETHWLGNWRQTWRACDRPHGHSDEQALHSSAHHGTARRADWTSYPAWHFSGSARSPTLVTGTTLEELRQAVAAIGLYSKAYGLPEELILLRLDGQYGTGAVIADLAGFSYVTRGKDYTVLDWVEAQSRLHLPPDQQFTRSESDLVRALYDCPGVPVGPTGQRSRVVVATHPTNARKSRIGVTRAGVVYELFFSNLPQSAFTAADVVAFYLHRGAFEPILADEDQEQEPDRWCSHSPAGQEVWQIINQWLWNEARWNWDISFIPIHCAPPSLLLLVRVRRSKRLPSCLPYKDTHRQMWPCPGNKDASLVATLPSSRM